MGLNWKGKQVEAEIIARLKLALGDIGLDIEGEGKQQLYPGHGVITGTLRRSIHAASGDHVFAADAAGQELGGSAPQAVERSNRLLIAVGSGLNYAMTVHQGHGAFQGYHYMTNAVQRAAPRALDHVRRRSAR